MKRTRIALFIVTTLLAATAFAATPVPAPTMPSDLATAWEKIGAESCAVRGIVIVRTANLSRVNEGRFLIHITKNGFLVARMDSKDNSLTVKQMNDSWLRYDLATEEAAGLSAIDSILSVTPQEFMICMDAQDRR